MNLRTAAAAVAGLAGTAMTVGALIAAPAVAAPSPQPASGPSAQQITSPPVGPRDGPTASTLSLSTSQVTFGQEDQETFSVTVRDTAGGGGTQPSGQVLIVEGTTALCSISLVFSNGSCHLTASQLPPGAHTLFAAYRGDSSNSSDNSPPATLTVAKGQPTAFLSLFGTTLEYGQEGNTALTVTANPNGGITPTGTVFVTAENGTTALCAANLAGTDAASCTMNGIALVPGVHQLIGSYNGDANYNSAASAAQAITVVRDGMNMTQTVPAALRADQEGGALLSFTLSPDVTLPAIPPSGMVTFSTGGTVLCTATVTGLTGSCALTAGQLPALGYQVSADYSGDLHYSPSSAADAVMVVLAAPPSPTTTALTLSAPTATFGHEQAEQLSIQVSEQPAPARKLTPRDVPAGTVTINAGSATVCVITLAQAKGTCTITATSLKPGSYQLTASYAGSSTFQSSTSAPAALTVAAEPTATTLMLSAAKVKAGKEQSEKLSVQVAPKFTGTPAGKVTIKAGSAKLCVITLKAAKGSCTLTASQLKAGTYHLTAAYPAASPFAGSTSPRKTFTVTKN